MLRPRDILILLFCFYFLGSESLGVEAKKSKRKRKKKKKKKKVAEDDWIDREIDRPDRDGLTEPTHLLIIENHTEETLKLGMLIPIYDTPDGEPGFGHKDLGNINPYEKKLERTYAEHEYVVRTQDRKLVKDYVVTKVPLEQYMNIRNEDLVKEKTEL